MMCSTCILTRLVKRRLNKEFKMNRLGISTVKEKVHLILNPIVTTTRIISLYKTSTSAHWSSGHQQDLKRPISDQSVTYSRHWYCCCSCFSSSSITVGFSIFICLASYVYHRHTALTCHTSFNISAIFNCIRKCHPLFFFYMHLQTGMPFLVWQRNCIAHFKARHPVWTHAAVHRDWLACMHHRVKRISHIQKQDCIYSPDK